METSKKAHHIKLITRKSEERARRARTLQRLYGETLHFESQRDNVFGQLEVGIFSTYCRIIGSQISGMIAR